MTLSLQLHPTAAAMPMLVVAAATLVLGAAVLARERASAVTLSFFILTLSVWTWLTGVSLMTMAITPRAAFDLARFAYVGVATVPAAVLQFTVSLLGARAAMRFRLADLTPSLVADMLLETIHGGVIVVDTHGRVRVANDVAADLLGWTQDQLFGADLRKILGVPVLPATDSDSFARSSRTRNRIAKWRRRDDTEIELTVSATALRDTASSEPIGVLYAISDIADRRRAERNAFDATHDFLTR